MYTPLPSMQREKAQASQEIAYAASRLPSFTSFCKTLAVSFRPATVDWSVRYISRTRALIVPCSACLWFRLNLGSVPLREGYRWVFGFLILFARRSVSCHPVVGHRRVIESKWCAPVPVSLLGLVVLGRVLGFCGKDIFSIVQCQQGCGGNILAIVSDVALLVQGWFRQYLECG